MRILMLGNSLTSTNNLPKMISDILDCEVVGHTRDGARLSEQYNPKTASGQKTLNALKNEKWDFVIMQEMSKAPYFNLESFRRNVIKLSKLARDNGAVPVLYAHWAYLKDSKALERNKITYEDMYRTMHSNFLDVSKEAGCLMADVCKKFYELDDISLYNPDGVHPTEKGSMVAAEIICRTIKKSIGK